MGRFHAARLVTVMGVMLGYAASNRAERAGAVAKTEGAEVRHRSTAHCVGLVVPFEGDEAAATCVVRYSSLDGGQQRIGHPLVADAARREFRGSLPGLRPDTRYTVSVTVEQPGGGGGRTLLTGTGTLPEHLPIGEGKTFHIAPDGDDTSPGTKDHPLRTIQAAADRARRRDTILIRPGTYREQVTVRRPDWDVWTVTFKASGGDVVIDGEGKRDHNFLLEDVEFVRVSGLRLVNAKRSAVVVRNGAYVEIDGNDIADPGTEYFDAGVEVGQGCEAVSVLGNRITFGDARPYTGGRMGVCLRNTKGAHRIGGNTIVGNGRIKDGVGGEGNFETSGGPGPNTDIHDNVISGCRDDGIEAEGGNENVRIWGNRIDACLTGIALAPTINGPCYVWRNVVTNVGSAAFKLGEGERKGHGPLYLYHNTVWSPGTKATGYAGSGGDGLFENVTARNNLICVGGYVLEDKRGGAGNSFDHDLLWTGGTDRFAKWAGRRVTLEEARDGVGFWARAVAADPALSRAKDGDFAPAKGSPAVDAAATLAGFNDDFHGRGPDIGAVEAR